MICCSDNMIKQENMSGFDTISSKSGTHLNQISFCQRLSGHKILVCASSLPLSCGPTLFPKRNATFLKLPFFWAEV